MINNIEELIKELDITNEEDINWDEISCYNQLSENFIKEFKDKVNWKQISQHQKLSENFIREFKDNVDWYRIIEYQELSEDFKKEFSTSIINNLIKMINSCD